MFLYKVSTGNPEGYDTFLVFTSIQAYSQAQFESMVEECIIKVYEKSQKEQGFSSIDTDYLEELLKQQGLEKVTYTAAYDFEPYWGKTRIKSQRLLEIMDKPDNYCITCEEYEPHEDNKSPDEINAMVAAGTIERTKDTCSKYLCNKRNCSWYGTEDEKEPDPNNPD